MVLPLTPCSNSSTNGCKAFGSEPTACALETGIREFATEDRCAAPGVNSMRRAKIRPFSSSETAVNGIGSDSTPDMRMPSVNPKRAPSAPDHALVKP